MILSQEMALLVLSWQLACLEQEEEVEPLLEGATTATLAEDKVLDRIKEQENMSFSWNDFNTAYSGYSSAASRLQACVDVLFLSAYDYRVKTVCYLIEMAKASHEGKSEEPVSSVEKDFILKIQEALNVQKEDLPEF